METEMHYVNGEWILYLKPESYAERAMLAASLGKTDWEGHGEPVPSKARVEFHTSDYHHSRWMEDRAGYVRIFELKEDKEALGPAQ